MTTDWFGRNMVLGVLVMLVTLGTLGTTPLLGADVLQWRNDRTGVYTETGLLKAWPEGGPTLLWSSEEVGGGYASPIVVKGKLSVTGLGTQEEFVTCFDLQGKKLWKTVYSTGWPGSYPESRTTPTWVDGKIYVISGKGDVVCIDAETGKILWTRDVWAEVGGTQGMWGVSESPLVVDGLVICTPCGNQTTMVALKVADGTVAWKSKSLGDSGAYVCPILIDHKGVKQIVGVTSKHIFGVAPATGAIAWSFDYYAVSFDNGGNRQRHIINCNSPIYRDGRIFVTSGYDHACVQLALNDDASAVTVVWKNDILDTHHGHVVLVGDHLYGSNWLNNSKGNWVCLDWQTGKKLYEESWQTKGSIIYADGMLYCHEEKRGTVGLVPCTPKGFEVVSSFRITMGSKAHWCHPIISDGIFYIRRGEALMAYDLRPSK